MEEELNNVGACIGFLGNDFRKQMALDFAAVFFEEDKIAETFLSQFSHLNFKEKNQTGSLRNILTDECSPLACLSP